VSVVVLLLAGAGVAGYLYGLGEADRKLAETSGTESAPAQAPEVSSSEPENPAPVTFYTVLTEPRDETAPSPNVEKSPPAKPAKKEKAALPANGGSLMLQVASFKIRQAAVDLLGDLSAEGYTGTVQVADLGERGTWHRVMVGPYKSEKEAGDVLESLRQKRNLKGYIVR
jgi:cell division septation protein DedD